MLQRTVDIFLSGLALLVLAPLLIPVVLMLRFTGEGEVLFLQERVGEGGKLFRLYKFATMLKNSPNMGTGTVTLKEDPRVLPVGKFLRKTKINELPQLLNIFRGDMSMVGPRPQTPRCFMAFPHDIQMVITRVKPGLSGIGSIIFRVEEDILANSAGSTELYDNVIAPYKGVVEAWYVSHRGITTYIKVILVTIWVVLRPSSSLVWRVFNGLPEPPDPLRRPLKYPTQPL
jgi:lipopolysaccharide/colanic/teichoic acid biosynthesis glycosyltransferase